MTSDWNMRSLVCDSQNFTLRLSEDSSIEDSSLQRFVGNKKTEDEDDIVISDTSSDSLSEHIDKLKWKSSSTSNVKSNKKKDDQKFLDRESTVKTNIQVDKTSNNRHLMILLVSNNTLLTSSDTSSTNDKSIISSDISYDRDQVNKSNTKRSNTKTPRVMLIEQEIGSKLKEKYNIKETNKEIIPSCARYNGSPNVLGRLNRYPTCNSPQQNSTSKTKLTKKDAHKILKNIKGMPLVYNSPREKKEINVIIDESIDTDEDVIHPAISPSYNRKVQHPNESPDAIDINLKNHIIPDSQTDLSELSKVHNVQGNECFSMPQEEDLYRLLSERKKKEIMEWLLTNASDSRSDSSSSNIPPSVRNSHSGNSSLEKLELNYETPNNRRRINKTQTEKQRTIINFDRLVHSSLTRQTTLDQFLKKFKNNNSEFCIPDILDKLYGASWRDKANALLPTTEPRKTSIQTTNRTVQTERKPISKNKYHAVDSDSDDFVVNKPDGRRNVQQKQKKADNFINDESSSDESESSYHSALTNPTIFTNSKTKSVSVPTLIRRLQAICDTDTEDEDDKSSRDPKNLHRRKLSFSDDSGSSTSEFDSGDFVPPKYICRKDVAKKPQSSKISPRFESTTTTKSAGYKTFLASLSNTVPMNQVHPNAKKYRLDYKNNKEQLCEKLYKMYNKKVFDNKLPRDMLIEWNIRMRKSAGYCSNKKTSKTLSGVVKSSRIVLATKVLDTPDRLRDTLIHEMCHAAVWLINDVSDGHGPFWTGWANKAMRMFPELPPIRRCHDYEIKTKFTYRCTICGYSIGRHSKSLNIDKNRCGYCYGKFELLINKTTKSGVVQMPTRKREPIGFALYVKQNYNSVRKDKSNLKHTDVMKILGQQFSAIKIAKENDVASNEGCGPFDATNASKRTFLCPDWSIERFEAFVASSGPQPKNDSGMPD